jgi:ABC-type multidrug transport system fused ATPase/permease subunit
MHIGVYFYFEIFSLIASIYFYIQKRNKLLLYFIPFLFITVTVELAGQLLYANGYRNYWIYNLFTTIEFLFYSFLFYIHFKKKGIKKIVLLFIPVYSCVWILNILFLQGFNKTFHTYTFLLGSFFIVIFCCCFFYESVLPDKIDQQLSTQPFFWIASGLLIFYLGSVIINALFEYLRSNDLRDEGRKIYGIINNILNILLYSSFCIAFYLCRNNKKISS